jgi:hypothetical protein
MADYELKPWQRRIDLKESGPAYHAFQHLRALPPRARSTDRAYTVCHVICPRKKHRIQDIRNVGKAPDVLPEPLMDAHVGWRRWRRLYLWDQASCNSMRGASRRTSKNSAKRFGR